MKRLTILSACLALFLGCGGDSPTSPSRSVANYAGNWNGTYSISGCNQSGGIALANVCQVLGQTPRYSFNLTQSGNNVAGTFALGTIQFPQTGGTIGPDTSLALNATSVSEGITVVVSWNLRLTGNTLSGSITQTWTAQGLSGSATVTGNIATSTR